MASNRRNFLRTSAAVGFIGASVAEASAAPGDFKWIAFLHSTTLDQKWEEAFHTGLRSHNFEGDPTQALNGNTRVIIKQIHGLGKYGFNHKTDFQTAAQDIPGQTPNLQLVVAAGGNVAALAAASVTMNVPILVLYGRKDNSIESKITGFNLGLSDVATDPPQLMKMVTYLSGPKYNVTPGQMCLFYNANSAAFQDQLNDWATATRLAAPKQYDASQAGPNDAINFSDAISSALALTNSQAPRALVFTSDPFFTINRREIIQVLRHQDLTNLVVCFPFSEYFTLATELRDFNEANCMAWGPKLEDVYRRLGVSAAGILSGATPNSGTVGVTFHYSGLPQ